MGLGVIVSEYGPKNYSTGKLIRHISNAVGSFGAQAGFAAAAFPDQLSDPITYIGLGVLLLVPS